MFSQKYPISVNQYEWETTHPNQSRFCFSLFHCDLDYWTWNVSSQYCHGNTIRYCAALPVGGGRFIPLVKWLTFNQKELLDLSIAFTLTLNEK